jgi:hypothetical protein
MKTAPDDLSLYAGNYSMEIILGSFSHSHPLRYRLGTLSIDGVVASSRSAVVYGPLPEIHHVFRDDERTPPVWISYAFTLMVLIPWIILLIGVICYVRLNFIMQFRINHYKLYTFIFYFY